MTPTIFPVKKISEGEIFIMPKPRGNDWLEDEIVGFKNMGISGIVSLLTEAEELELGLKLEKQISEKNDIKFFPFPIEDRGLPESSVKYIEFIYKLYCELKVGNKLTIHCRAGIGRSGITAASLLIASGIPPYDSFDIISKSRGFEVPDTNEQKHWIIALEKELQKIITWPTPHFDRVSR